MEHEKLAKSHVILCSVIEFCDYFTNFARELYQICTLFATTKKLSINAYIKSAFMGPNAKFARWPCTFHVFCVDFICVCWPMQTQYPVEYGLKCCCAWRLDGDTDGAVVTSSVGIQEVVVS